MAAGNKIGIKMSELLTTTPKYGSLILEIPKSQSADILFNGVTHQEIGQTTDDGRITAPNADMDLDEIIQKWQEPLESVFPVKTRDNQAGETVPNVSWQDRDTRKPAGAAIPPRIVIPAFPGTNCEMDAKRAFERAGGKADIHIIRNLTEEQLIESTKELEQKIRQSQIIMLPGGFSGGDEPDGSAKFITAIFQNPRIKEAVQDLLENRDGLMLGICNGFQALIKLGLVPEGKIITNKDSRPTLTYNKIGRHVSSLVRTRIASVKSPWLSGTNVDEIHTLPVSHGEGRFIADPQVLEKLVENGQIATQYVDFDGNPSMDIAFNPNGSDMAIEGITSPDGRVFGKMGHSERIGPYVYKNVPGQMDQKIFESGINYFK
jgi:phosphoribosylformylglycinamidine synthase